MRDVAKKPPPLADRLVAELTFGFWVTLLSGPYDQRIWARHNFALLATVFPHASGISRDQIHQRFNRIRLLRNRVMHYEPIWDRRKIDLSQRHVDIHQAIRWISPTLGSAIRSVDGFHAAFTGRGRVETDLKTLLGIP